MFDRFLDRLQAYADYIQEKYETSNLWAAYLFWLPQVILTAGIMFLCAGILKVKRWSSK